MLLKLLCLVAVFVSGFARHISRNQFEDFIKYELKKSRDEKSQDSNNFCSGKKTGNYANPEKCDGFIQCVHGKTYFQDCPAGNLHYDAVQNACDYGKCEDKKPTQSSPQVIEKGICRLGNGLTGTIHLNQFDDGSTVISGVIQGTGHLNPGPHGFHVHTYGDLSRGCSSTGGHYNPNGNTHGGPNSANRHVADLGNIIADSEGGSVIHIVDRLVKLTGATSVFGRAMVVHFGKDDLGEGDDAGSLKTGNAGSRVGCCLIGRVA